jgi:hypothetical protein
VPNRQESEVQESLYVVGEARLFPAHEYAHRASSFIVLTEQACANQARRKRRSLSHLPSSNSSIELINEVESKTNGRPAKKRLAVRIVMPWTCSDSERATRNDKKTMIQSGSVPACRPLGNKCQTKGAPGALLIDSSYVRHSMYLARKIKCSNTALTQAFSAPVPNLPTSPHDSRQSSQSPSSGYTRRRLRNGSF